MSALHDMLETLALEIESVEGLLFAGRAHLREVQRNGCDGNELKDAEAAVAALERKLKMLRDVACELRRSLH